MSIPIFLHIFSVLPAVLLGVYILCNKKGTTTHKTLGRIWAGLMLFTSFSSFFILHEGRFSWIHILSLITIASIAISIWGIRNHKIKIHRGFMIGAFVGSIIAGIFATIMPGRFLYTVLFGG